MRLVTAFGIGTLAVGVVFVPWALLQWLTKGELGVVSVLVLTPSMPALAWTVCHFTGRLASARDVARLVPFVIFVGIWMAGSVIMIFRAVVFGEALNSSLAEAADLLFGLPLVALIAAGYQGTFFGLLLASLVIWFPNAAWGDV
jgi:hypothetical protein